jgi:hypothetical protein
VESVKTTRTPAEVAVVLYLCLATRWLKTRRLDQSESEGPTNSNLLKPYGKHGTPLGAYTRKENLKRTT